MAQPAPAPVAEQPKPMEDEAKATITHLMKRIAELESQLSRSGFSAPMPATGGFGAPFQGAFGASPAAQHSTGFAVPVGHPFQEAFGSAAQHSTGFVQIAPDGFGAAAPSSAFGTPASNPEFAFGTPAARPRRGHGICPKCNDFWHFGECSQPGINADLQRRISMLEHNVNAIWQKMQK